MNYTKVIIAAFLFVSMQVSVNAQEKKIKFSKGILKICSSKNFTIKGYNGNEVVIKSLHDKKSSYVNLRANNSQGFAYTVNGKAKNSLTRLNKWKTLTKSKKGGAKHDSVQLTNVAVGQLYFSNYDKDRKKGLKKLGKKQENLEFGIYFTIEEKNGELIFKDNIRKGGYVMHSDESYEIKIPNSVKLNWSTGKCKKPEGNKDSNFFGNSEIRFYNSKASTLSDFNGEVEISTSLSNMILNDVTGPVSINTIGGNVTISFDKKTPKKLYSIYSNNGFIDIKLPKNSDIVVDATGASIYSDLGFKVLEDKEQAGMQYMKLKMKNGKVKMKLNAGLGSIYLRKN
ncbi:MAG: hypothetical protein JKY02_09710 [Flavobacteriaceae bacterium]|nr:hypothetical protein [Flavobacteriaceae bacterium]